MKSSTEGEYYLLTYNNLTHHVQALLKVCLDFFFERILHLYTNIENNIYKTLFKQLGVQVYLNVRRTS